jgi:hypothetical protein
MIKIKNDVYFKELYKYGFKMSDGNTFMYKPRKYTDIPLITIDVKTKIISIQGICDMHNTVEDTLYSLFKDDLVEEFKVEIDVSNSKFKKE